MHPGALRALEFDRIVEAVLAFALTPMGRTRLADLDPAVERAEVASLLAETSEAVRFVASGGSFPLRAAAELSESLEALSVEGRALEPLRLLALATFLESVERTRAGIRRAPGSFPRLVAVSGGVSSFAEETAATRRAIDESGEVLDAASPALKGIREHLRKQRARLRGALESYLRGRETAKYLQDQIVTERNGRHVLLVKAEHRGSIPGIVHGASTSGASLFLEPLATVDINNDIVALEEEEQEEIRRILLALTDAFRVRGDEMARTIDAAASLDVLQAKAAFSEDVGGIEPALASDGRLELLGARHPLLKDPVPVTIRIVPPSAVLLITGPNTGGKTVALKTAGLLALMAQAGLRIPAVEGSALPVFRSLFADIGDEQSIEASLSTFSAHIANIVSMEASLETPALVLLDEVGSGTDPVEGGALGVAIVEHFRTRGALLVATSHYDTLKTYAATTAEVTSAAFGFDAATYAPTYELLYGTPGRSLALEMAGRLGLPASVVTNARALLSARDVKLAEQIARLDSDVHALEQERRAAAREREALETAKATVRQREEGIREREEAFGRRLNEQLGAQVRQARREIDGIIAELKARADAMSRDAKHVVTTGETGAVRSEARNAVDAVISRLSAGDKESAVAHTPVVEGRAPVPGDRVVVGAFGLEGVVTTVHGDAAEVDVNGKRMRARTADLRIISGAPAAAARVRINIDLKPREGSTTDLNVIGCTVDEALVRAERFLDESMLGEQRTIRVIHGYGTGQLKRALSGFLHQHPLVAHVASAPPEQGGGGVTVVELKD